MRKKLDLVCLQKKEDSKELGSGVIRDRRVTYEMMNDKNILDAAEVLLAVNDADYLTSKADLLSRALDYGWTPVNTDEVTFSTGQESGKSPDNLILRLILRLIEIPWWLIASVSLIVSIYLIWQFSETRKVEQRQRQEGQVRVIRLDRRIFREK